MYITAICVYKLNSPFKRRDKTIDRFFRLARGIFCPPPFPLFHRSPFSPLVFCFFPLPPHVVASFCQCHVTYLTSRTSFLSPLFFVPLLLSFFFFFFLLLLSSPPSLRVHLCVHVRVWFTSWRDRWIRSSFLSLHSRRVSNDPLVRWSIRWDI